MKRIVALILALLLMLGLPFSAFAEGSKEATVLFTHDLHSHFLPSPDGQGGEFGGYARLTTAIKEQKKKAPDAIFVDGGDFSMGSLFQTAYASSPLELRMMGAMGYDATTFGNHEFDYLPAGLTAMLGAVESTSMGLLTTTPRDAEGNPIAPDELVNFVIKDQEGKPVKEWYAIATYLLSMGGQMDPAYAAPDGRKVVYSSLNPAKLLSNANVFTYVLLGVILLVLALIALAIWLILRKIKKKKLAAV